MRKFLHITSQIIAGAFAVLFVLTALLSILLVTMGSRLFNPNLYKTALLDQEAYEELPEIIGEMLVSSASYDPCAENPIRCEEMAPELAACYIEELGGERFTQLTSGEAEPLPVGTAAHPGVLRAVWQPQGWNHRQQAECPSTSNTWAPGTGRPSSSASCRPESCRAWSSRCWMTPSPTWKAMPGG